jgi:hypothetical protein
MKNAFFLDVKPCGSCKNGRVRGTYPLLFTANIVLSSLILVTLMMQVMHSSVALVFTRAARHNITEDGIIHNYLCENLKSYIVITGWAL